MPIAKNWSRATESHIRQNVPQKKGIYELKSFGELVYIGSSGNLQNRLLTHLQQRNPNYYRYTTVGFLTSPSSAEREAYNNYMSRHGASPRWNNRQP